MASPISSFGSFGGNGTGNPWRYLQIGDGNGIAGIAVHVAGTIKSISFKDAKGLKSGIFGGTNNDVFDLGKLTQVDFAWPKEYLTTVSGSFGVVKNTIVITSLTFTTNETTYGPFGTPSIDAFSIPTEGNVVVGFFGTCGYDLNSLGFFTTLAPLPLIPYGPSGGDGGGPYTYHTRNPIVKFVLRVSGNIKSISFIDSVGQTSGVFGGSGDNLQDSGEEIEINLDSGNYWTGINGSYGNYKGFNVITSLTFTTNLVTYGPYGTPGTSTFSYPIENDNILAGLFGASGIYLDSLGVYLTPMKSE